jgi:phosphoglycerate kinase
MARFHTLGDLDVAGRRVLVRADLNVPLDGNRVGDGMRIARLAPTILELARRQARTIVLSHLGRPKGTVVPEMSLRPVVAPLSEALEGRPVAFAEDCIGDAAETVVNGLEDGGVALLENLRFHGGEETNDEDFARRLASLGELYVNDAFSCSHRAHASITALARLLPAAAGRGMEAELRALGHALDSPARPLAAVVGGAKVSTKIALLENLVAKVDVLIIGGGMANTFLAARGIEVGASLCEEGHFETARRVLAAAELAGCEVVLPADGDNDPGHWAGERQRDPFASGQRAHAGMERSPGRLRDAAVRFRHHRGSPRRRAADARGQAQQHCRRRRHPCRAQPCRRAR